MIEIYYTRRIEALREAVEQVLTCVDAEAMRNICENAIKVDNYNKNLPKEND